MKHQRVFLALLLVFCAVGLLLASASPAASAEETKAELIEQKEKSLQLRAFYEEEPKRLIKCFDVNEEGYYAIGYEAFGVRSHIIQVYDPQGVFQYGISYYNRYSYGITLKENSILLHGGRGDYSIEVDPAGKCIDAQMLVLSDGTHNAIMNRTHKQIGNVNYYLERDIGLADYPRLVKIDENGNKTVLHNLTVRGYIAGVFSYTYFLILPVGIVLFIRQEIRKEDEARAREMAEESKKKEADGQP